MKAGKWRRRLATGAGVVVLGGLAIAAGAHLLSEKKMQRRILVSVEPVAYASGNGAVDSGRYLYASRGCIDCHGANGAGRVFIDESNGLYVRGANITPATGGAVATYQQQDWVRAIRHGIKPNGRPVLIMPSEDYNRLTNGDLADLVAFMRAFPPVEGEGAVIRLPLIVKALYAAGYVQDAAEKIDHSLPSSTPIPAAPTVEHGRYVANTCIGCHGPGLSGGRIPGTPPDWPPAANLTFAPTEPMARYARPEDLKILVRTGQRPDGGKISRHMPKLALNDTDLEALHVYLRSLPARPAGGR